MSDIDSLREQLRERGYLSHGIERWFALDPWSSRTFWVELATVALKAAVLIAAFGALPMTAVMLFRNFPLSAYETLALFLSYAAAWLAGAFVFIVAIALVLKVRPALPIDTPRALLAISLGASALLLAPLAWWWWRFDALPSLPELATGAALAILLFIVATVVTSAALLSFSIYELHRIPAIHQKPRSVPIATAAAVLIALLFVPALAERERPPAQSMVVTTPTERRVALVAVDGLTYNIFYSKPELRQLLPHMRPVRPIGGDSAPERWASLGTGVTPIHHRVRAIEGVRFRGGAHVLQRISRADVVLLDVVPLLGVARREPLPPTVRRRDYVWEITARRGVPSVAVNWWTTAARDEGALRVIGPEAVFGAARGEPLRLDASATAHILEAIDRHEPQLATVYLPALDVILNRVALDRSEQLTSSLRVLEGIANLVALIRARGYEVILAGMPGETQSGAAVIASSVSLARPATAWDVAPTLLDLAGFPLSAEMPGRSLVSSRPQPRVASYGARATDAAAHRVDEEYYENLRSLGYIR